MEPVPAKEIYRYTALSIRCGKCNRPFYRLADNEIEVCPFCKTPNNLATTWNERKDNV